MQLPIDAASLGDMKYAELQKLAKKIGVKANMKADKLVKTIRELLEQQEYLVEQPLDAGDSGAADNDVVHGDQTERVEEAAPKASKKTRERKGRKGRKGKKTTKETDADEELSASDAVTMKTQTVTPVHTGGAIVPVQLCNKTSSTSKSSDRVREVSTPVITTTNRRTRTISYPHMTTPIAKTTKCHTKSPAVIPVAKKTTRRTHTISPVKSPKVTTPIVMATKRRTHTLSPVVQKMATPVKKISTACSKVQHAAVTPDGSVKTNKVKRKRTVSADQDAELTKSKRLKRETIFSSGPLAIYKFQRRVVSPSMKKVLDSLDNGLSDTELKESIKQAVEKRVQEKGIDMSLSKTVIIAGTNIPRFTALAKGLSVTKPTVTPGHKDWSRIHQRTFEKMESIDVYLKKRNDRAQSVSAIKVKEMTQRMRTALNSLKKIKTPPQSHAGKGPKIVKPVPAAGSKVKNSLFQTPASTFVPKVTSVSKINLQFGSNASCKTKTPLPSLANSAKENLMSPKAMNVTFDAKRKSGVVNIKRKSGTTPFVFRGNLNQSTAESKVKTFDLQESLSRKITWKPHRGKLQPFVAPDAYKAPPKEVKGHSRDGRRKTAQKHRADRRLNSQLSRRGITITS